MRTLTYRSSASFVTFVVAVASFTDTLLLNLVIPILPYVLSDRIKLSPAGVQRWNSILVGSYGGALMVGCRE